MRLLAAIKQHNQRRWVQRLRILAQPSAVLLLALCFAFAEPLACILHCQLYVPWLLRHQRVHQRTQTPKIAVAARSFAPFAAATFVAEPSELLANTHCFQASGGNSLPAPDAPPSPVHEVILVDLFMLTGTAAVFGLPARAPPLPRSCGTAPLTPPPAASPPNRARSD